MLLIKNQFWNDAIERYLIKIVEKCTGCRHTSLLQNTCKVSLSSLSRSFNKVVCIDHFCLNQICVFPVMKSTMLYSSRQIVLGSALPDALMAIESFLLGQFWPPLAVLGDSAFSHTEFFE